MSLSWFASNAQPFVLHSYSHIVSNRVGTKTAQSTFLLVKPKPDTIHKKDAMLVDRLKLAMSDL
jgi:hypothetical protein